MYRTRYRPGLPWHIAAVPNGVPVQRNQPVLLFYRPAGWRTDQKRAPAFFIKAVHQAAILYMTIHAGYALWGYHCPSKRSALTHLKNYHTFLLPYYRLLIAGGRY
ncbi:hypothetical protein A8C56_03060 [Niabella ginsenosidivorans]|uniref:Uncharacterized protein n=1 Tax=Niabella ginsenosidivorans TaxID=1176587 RepID=A0A1A9HZ73_9BACT|nr:hypothetical protein A8C56_03060 [Niabella ginsenosidivorans]